MRLQGRWRIDRAPAVVEQHAPLGLEATAFVGKRAPAAAAILGNPCLCERGGVRQAGRPGCRCGANRGIGWGAGRAAGACYVTTRCHAQKTSAKMRT